MDTPAGGDTPQGRIRLFHGTTPEKARKILAEGFIPELSKQHYYQKDKPPTQCVWFTTDMNSARLYGEGAVVEIQAWKSDLEKLGCEVGLGSNEGWDDVHCCSWDNALADIKVWLLAGENDHNHPLQRQDRKRQQALLEKEAEFILTSLGMPELCPCQKGKTINDIKKIKGA